jgi:hypothetical protein
MTEAQERLLKELRAWRLAFPGAHAKARWRGHDDLAVRDETFAHLAAEAEPFSVSCKLPHTHSIALELPCAAPTGDGLGKSGG